MLIARTNPEEWKRVEDDGKEKKTYWQHPELGDLHFGKLGEMNIDDAQFNELYTAISDGHIKIKMRKRIERIAQETSEAVAKMNAGSPYKILPNCEVVRRVEKVKKGTRSVGPHIDASAISNTHQYDEYGLLWRLGKISYIRDFATDEYIFREKVMLAKKTLPDGREVIIREPDYRKISTLSKANKRRTR